MGCVGLEEQISNLKDQFAEELQKRQQLIAKSARAHEEMRTVRGGLDSSLASVAHDVATLENDSKKLESVLSTYPSGRYRSSSPFRKQ